MLHLCLFEERREGQKPVDRRKLTNPSSPDQRLSKLTVVVVTLSIHSAFKTSNSTPALRLCNFAKRICTLHRPLGCKPQPHNHFTAGARRELLYFMVQGKINRGRNTDHPAGRHSIRTNQCLPPPSPHIFYKPDALPAAQPTASKHWRQLVHSD